MKELEYPFDVEYLFKNKKKIKRQLLDNKYLVEKRIAILGGSTTNDIKNMLELFLLNYGIKPLFYESSYNKYYEDAVFENKKLDEFVPDIIYIHTTFRNIINIPNIIDDKKTIENKIEKEFQRYMEIWNNLNRKYNAIIIQNNFEKPHYRLMGNRDVYDYHGILNFIDRMNNMFYNYANEHDNFYIADIDYISSCYGLDRWHDLTHWYLYKYAMSVDAIPYLSFNLANIIKSIYGKNKKSIVLDMDNTLWGGVIGEDGIDNISIGPEIPNGQVYYEFQEYLKRHKDMGIILNINSKNDYDNALAGLNNPSGVLKPEDFVIIKANWENKNDNMKDISTSLNLGLDSFVFIDDNPVERDIVKKAYNGISTPEIKNPEDYIKIIDRNGYFEITNLSKEDLNKTKTYKENIQREELKNSFKDYKDYLRSLNMKSDIKTFDKSFVERISQLTNKSNQFNLTTKRYSTSDINNIMDDDNYIKLYGTLKDDFGDNGLISIIVGRCIKDELHIELLLMSCRVLKRDMEYAMMDEFIHQAKIKDIKVIYGYYYRTEKNKMVENLYELFGFKLIEEKDGNKTYVLKAKDYKNKNNIIKVNSDE